MTSLFKTSSKDTQAKQPSPLAGLEIQSSSYGKPLAALIGTRRVAPNVIWYDAFKAIPHTTSDGGTGGGKGSLFNQGSGSTTEQTTYTYSASFALALCEGPINSVGSVYINKSIMTLADAGFSLFQGTYPQSPWPYLTTNFPDAAFGFKGVAYVAANDYDLGSSANLPSHSFEVVGPFFGTIPQLSPYDADSSIVISQILTNPFWGVSGFTYLDDLTDYRAYAIASGFVMSALYDSHSSASSMLMDVVDLTNSAFIWTGKLLKVRPYGDQPVAANDFVWNPQPVQYDLTDDDFLPMSGGSGSGQSTLEGPILIHRKRQSDSLNSITLECLDRNKQYNAVPVQAKDQASIDQYGLRDNGSKQAHLFCDPGVGQISAQLALQRQSVSNTYHFSTDWRYARLDCMDYITLTHAAQGLDRVLVRILDYTENDDDTFTWETEEVLDGISTPAQYSFQQSQGFATNWNVDPGDCQAPLIFEPTDELVGGLQIWIATAGGVNWGGCEIWVSTDDITYTKAGEKFGPSRYGVTTSILNTIERAVPSPTIDPQTFGVNIAATRTQLLGGTFEDALALNTLSYVNGEYLSYQTATLTGVGTYDLSTLVRGALGTSIQAHAAGTAFARLDRGIAAIPYRQDRIGKLIYIKLLSFNIYGGTRQSLVDVAPYPYMITGLALTSPLPIVTQVRTVFKDRFVEIWWQEITDFRSGIKYIIRKGETFEGGQELGSLAHPPFVAFGEGTYWIIPTCQPLAGLIVFGEEAVPINIQGNMLTINLVQNSDFQALGWPGTLTNVGREGIDPTAILRLVGTANELVDPNVLTNPDILNNGEVVLDGIYEANDSSTILNVGYVADCYVNITWRTAGLPLGSDILTDPDILLNPDTLSSASAAYIEVWVEIRTSSLPNLDMFHPADMFEGPDFFTTGIVWDEWQRYVPGVYRAQYLEYRVVFKTLNSKVIAYLLALETQVSIPARIDRYIGNTVPLGGLTIVFMPDDAIEFKPFNGGPLVAGINNHPLPTVTMDWPGHPGVNFVIDAMSLSQMTFHMEKDDIGTHVAVSNVDTYVEGY